MKFKYQARTQEGEPQVGFVEASNRGNAAAILTSHNLFILSLDEAEGGRWYERLFSFVNHVSLRDFMVFLRQFATLLESEIPLNDALQSLARNTQNPILRSAISEMSSSIASGLSLSQAMERQSAIFSDFYINVVRSAEITGKLDEAMKFLADYAEKEVSWRSKLVNALIYPAFLVGLFMVVSVVMAVFVFPQIIPLFQEQNVSLPITTKVLFGATSFFLSWWWLVAVVFVLLVAAIVDYFRTEEGKEIMDDMVLRLPFLGGFFKKIYLARFAESVNVLIKGGIPLTQALEIASHSVGNVVYRELIHGIAERVKAGERFSDLLLHNENYFPPMVGQMTAIGENTGRLSDLLSRISSFYTAEVDNLAANLAELLQPILIAVIGVVVAILFASVLLPIYNLTQSF